MNARILETESHSAPRSRKDFGIELVREMMALHSSRKRKAQPSVDSVTPSEQYFPDLLPGVLDCCYCSSGMNRKCTAASNVMRVHKFLFAFDYIILQAISEDITTFVYYCKTAA